MLVVKIEEWPEGDESSADLVASGCILRKKKRGRLVDYYAEFQCRLGGETQNFVSSVTEFPVDKRNILELLYEALDSIYRVDEDRLSELPDSVRVEVP